MMKIQNIVKEHWVALGLALILSLVSVFPQVFFRIDQKEIYQGIELIPDSPWSARVREVQDGHPNFGSIYYKDGKDNPYLFQPLGSIVVGYMGKALSLDINNTLLLSRIVLPFVSFLLIYSFVLLLARQRFVALASASILLFADSVMSFSGLVRMLQGLSPDSFLRLARPVNPAMIYILLFAFLISFFLFYKRRDWKWGVASAIILGLNFYNYFYTWTYLYAFGGVLGLMLLIHKKWRDAFAVAAVFFGGVVVAIPCLLNLYRTTLHPVYAEAGMRTGIVMSHAPVFVGFVVLVSLLIFFFGFPKGDKERWLFGVSLLLTPFVTMNQQIITGKLLQEAHYHWFFHKPIGAIFVLIVAFYLLDKYTSTAYKKILGVLIIVLSIGTATFIQVHSYYFDNRDGGEILIERQRYGEVMDWLNANASKESMVFANDEISHITVIYTPLNVFYHRAAPYSLSATNDRLKEVLFTFYRLRGVDDKNVSTTFYSERAHISASMYGIHYRELLGSYEAIPDEKINEVITQYRETLQTPSSQWIEQTLKKYEVEYIIWDKKNDPTWNPDRFPFLQKSADFGDLLIYTLK